MTLSLEERRRELAIEAALGGTPRAVLFGVLGEAAVLGLAGGAVGIGFGLLAARPFVSSISHYAEQTAGIHLSVHTTAMNAVIGLAIGVAASVVAALVPARRAARLDIAGELVDRSRRFDASPRIRARRPIILSAIVVIGLTMAWLGSRHHGLESWAPTVLVAGIFMAWIAAFPLPPSAAPFLVRWIEKVPVLQRGPARVAVSNFATEARRTSTVLMAVGAAVGMAAMLGGVLPGMRDGARRLTADTAHGRVMVTTLTPNNNGAVDAKLSPQVQESLTHIPGVARVEHVVHSNIELNGVGLIALSAGDGDTKGFDVYQGESLEEARQRGHVMLGPALARALDLKPGANFTIPGRFGPVSLTVGGIWAAPDTLGRSITTTLDVFERIAGHQPVDWVLLVPEAGLSPAALADRVRAAGLAPNLMVFDPDELTTELAHDFEGFIAPFTVLTKGLLVVAFIATASTLLLAGVKRQAEHGLLAAVGMPPGDLGRMILVEAGLFGVIGTLCGLFGGVVSLMAFCLASTTMTGLYIPFHLDPMPLLTSGLIATAFVLAGAALPAWRTSRLDPVVALRYE
jgi:putative ABC transport system permease protein